MIDTKKEQERAELFSSIWSVADELRGSVDGWDFKAYVICTMFYRATGKNLTLYPVHIDQKKHCFEVQKPVMFDGERPLEEQQDALVKHLAAGLRGQHIEE